MAGGSPGGGSLIVAIPISDLTGVEHGSERHISVRGGTKCVLTP